MSLKDIFSPFDILCNGKRIDVKTRCGNVPLKGNYLLNCQAEHISIDKDVIAFCYFNEESLVVEVLGGLEVNNIPGIAELKRKGVGESNGFVYKCDTFVVRPESLLKLEELI